MSVVRPNAAASVGRESWPALLELSAREVFAVMLASQLAAPAESLPDEGIEITSMVGLAGEICGVLSVRTTAEGAGLIAAKMLGISPADAGPETWDAVGEVCNMIAGDFKHKIAGLGDGCMISVPTVITGGDYNLHALTDAGKIEVQLLFESSPLIVSLEVHS